MNIAVILPSLKNKAPIQVANDIINQLLKNECKVDVYYFEDIVELEFNCPIKKIGLFEEFEYQKYDIIHSHMIRPDFYIWWHRKKIAAICVSTLHNEIEKVLKDYYNIIISKIFTRLWVHFLKSFNKVICLSEIAKEQMFNNYNLNNLTYIHNGRTVSDQAIDKSDIDILFKKKETYIVLGLIANISKIKGIEQIIDILTHLNNYCLVIIGEGPDKLLLEKKATKLNLNERCLFLGFKENAHNYMKYFDIYMMTSYSEGFPLVLIEAAQFKKPVVCSDISVFREFFSETEVEFFKLDNSESLILAIRSAYNKREYLSKNIFIKYTKKYSVDKMGHNYLINFKELVARSKNNEKKTI